MFGPGWTRPPRPVDAEVYAAEVRQGIDGCLDRVPTNPQANLGDLFLLAAQNPDVRHRPIEDRDGVAALFLVAIGIGYVRAKHTARIPSRSA